MNRQHYTTLGDINEIMGFFSVYAERKSEHFRELFGENVPVEDIETLNNLLIDVYGDSIIMERFEKINDNMGTATLQIRLVNMCDMLHFENWKTLKNAIEKGFETDIETPLHETKTRTVETKGENSQNTQNKENAFDDTINASNTDSSELAGTNSENIEESVNWKRSNNRTTTDTAQRVIDFTRMNDFIKMILCDIMESCCLSIY